MNNDPGIKIMDALETAIRLQETIKWLPVMIDDEIYDSDLEEMAKQIELLVRFVKQEEKDWSDIYA